MRRPLLFIKTTLIFLITLATCLLVFAEEKKEITGYGPFDFTRTVTPAEVEKAGGAHLSVISKGQAYSFKAFDRFEGLVDFFQYYKMGKISPARQQGSVPRITATEIRLEDDRLWLIILYFNPNDYDDYLKIIKLEYGEPTVRSQKKKGMRRKDFWLSGNNCILLQQVMLDNAASGGHLEIQKGRCEQLGKIN